MVAPTRAPQARGVKCDLCKKILALATWLDQTKLAKEIEEAQTVLELIKLHDTGGCPCIPKNIENLLVGSTHFEIHRLAAKRLDAQVHKQQTESYFKRKQKHNQELKKTPDHIINDCIDTHSTTRFKLCDSYVEEKNYQTTRQSLRHLMKAVDYWRIAMDDQTNPFNSKLAHRLGLTHHVIYSCYVFKHFKILDYQLISANLLLNVFKAIEGVTQNAILHANYLLIRALVDCNQVNLARHQLKQATKMDNYNDKTHYEAILLTCIACELDLSGQQDVYNILDDLAKLAVIQQDDKLQHYYARVLAVSIIIKYIHCFPGRTDQCFEFFHSFRYICAMIRRCYEDSFDLVLCDKDLTKRTSRQSTSSHQKQILDHSWIKFAVCDFVFSTFEMLTEFYIRAGIPESLELLYNGLNLVAYRNGSCYWQMRILSIGADLDLLCDKHDHAKAKLDAVSKILSQTKDIHLMNIMRLDLEVNLLTFLNYKDKIPVTKEVVYDILQRIRNCHNSWTKKLHNMELYECKSGNFIRLSSHDDSDNCDIILGQNFGRISLRCLKTYINSIARANESTDARGLIIGLGNQLTTLNTQVLEYNLCQMLLEILLCFAYIFDSEQILLTSLSESNVFLETKNHLSAIETQLSSLTLNSEPESATIARKKRAPKFKGKLAGLTLARKLRRRGLYDVATRSEENLSTGSVRFFDTLDAIKNFASLSQEELVVAYLRNSEPNPSYLLYRKAHELMISFCLKDPSNNQDRLAYHFCESSTSNTIRYRWMMFDELQTSPYEPATKAVNYTKNIEFSNALINPDKTLRSFTKAIPEDSRLIQFKYILEMGSMQEHLLIACFLPDCEPFYIHTHEHISSDNFLEDAKAQNENKLFHFAKPSRFESLINQAKKTLFNSNQRSRTETRQRLETELGLLLHGIEDDWLGPFRFILCGQTCDVRYNKFIQQTQKDIQRTMASQASSSPVALRMMLENAPLLTRDEFCQVIAALYCDHSSSPEVRDCYNIWIKSMEEFVRVQAPKLNKTSYLRTIPRGRLGLILDKSLEWLPFESLPIVEISKQGIFRVPSLRLYHVLANRQASSLKVDSSNVCYILDPASNLQKTRERFNLRLKTQRSWSGCIGQPPKTSDLEEWLSNRDIYLFIGHGAGTIYYNQLCKQRGLSAMAQVRSLPIVMGCSSGRVQAEGPKLESFGINWVFIFRGSPAYVGLLWDVTDTDIDRFLDSLLSMWMPTRWSQEALGSGGDDSIGYSKASITDCVARARHVCQHKLLVGSTPVTYGLPVWCE